MNKYDKTNNDEDEDSGSSSGGSSGEIEFSYRDVLSIEPRDDLLTQQEITRHLAVHKDIHKERVDKQKQKRKDRQNAKEGPTNLVERKPYAHGTGGPGGYSKHKKHPKLNRFANNRDENLSPEPSQSTAETNQEAQKELENRLENENKLTLNYAPGQSPPKPRPF